MFNTAFVQDLMARNAKLGKNLGRAQIKVDYIGEEVVIEPTFLLKFGKINGKVAYQKMGRTEYQIYKRLGNK